MALTDSLDELTTSGSITPQLAMKVLQQVCGTRSSDAAKRHSSVLDSSKSSVK
ncbi:hypothetical protein H0H92_011166, partial [Tricholoma furcatifolium]